MTKSDQTEPDRSHFTGKLKRVLSLVARPGLPTLAAVTLPILVVVSAISGASAAMSMAAVSTRAPVGVAPIVWVREAPPNSRGCIPGPHELGRTRRMVGQAVMTGRPGSFYPSVEHYPHCRYDNGEEARRAARLPD